MAHDGNVTDRLVRLGSECCDEDQADGVVNVGSNLRKVFGKLGINSRKDMKAALAQLGHMDPRV